MPNDVGANGQSVVTKKSGGKVITGPDVCKTPVGSSVVPIPYPNISQSSDLASGSTTVKVNGASVCLKDSQFSKSSGDQAGTAGGVISGKTGAEAVPVSYSFDVKIEGKNVVRNFDNFVSNAKNTPPGPIMQAPVVPGAPASEPAEPPKCPYCKEERHELVKPWGTHMGNGQMLRSNIIEKVEKHRWYSGPYSLQAHHLIPSDAMADDDDWPNLARDFGYDINHENNGVMLPYKMDLACQLHAPLHRGNHEKGDAGGEPYPKRIAKDLSEVKEAAKKGDYCDNPRGLIEELDEMSELIAARVNKFRWTLTADGRDYKAGGNGCAGVSSITRKPSRPCPHDREHEITRHNEKDPIPRKSEPLEVGT